MRVSEFTGTSFAKTKFLNSLVDFNNLAKHLAFEDLWFSCSIWELQNLLGTYVKKYLFLYIIIKQLIKIGPVKIKWIYFYDIIIIFVIFEKKDKNIMSKYYSRIWKNQIKEWRRRYNFLWREW